jgi:methionyl-tRNA formyltransferase
MFVGLKLNCWFLILEIFVIFTMVRSFVHFASHKTLFLSRRSLIRFHASSSSSTGQKAKRIVFLGTPQVAALTLDTLHKAAQSSVKGNNPFEVVRVVSQPPAMSGRKQVLTPSPVQALAKSLDIPVLTPENAKDEDFLSELESLNVDLFITAAYGNYLPKRFLSIPKYGTINIHPSLLPKYRGAAPVQRCLEQGDSVTGVSVLYSVAKMDAGPIIAQIPYILSGDEHSTNVLNDCFAIGINTLIEKFPEIFAGTVSSSEQDHQLATNAPKIDSSEGLINFANFTARQIHNKARAFSEWPGIFGYFKIGSKQSMGDTNGLSSETVRIKILATKVIGNGLSIEHDNSNIYPTSELKAGKFEGKDVLEVTCKNGSVLGILELQPAGKKPMNAKAFANGLRDRVVEWVCPPSPSSTTPNQ